ncbi:sugar phosphate isomerase/epimerase [Paenibacillus sp. MWE-103]|uniref:Sugar phosphate isomerase/epimerase n=1 Tax=Paenibacillus artemisiicola TaxID=1172618 RepID=A0ABS3WFU7_9BACL|nr:sugar phosphate isomerase/epimerase [Paenibacillus artemisiicola]MBO7747180.1 sugar phosphate isomerase/epimerase [Paenibacillus artemisiicola]
MRIGIFAKTFRRDSLAGVLDAVRAHGFASAQFNMACAGMASMPERADADVAAAVKREADVRGIRLEAVSGTFNMAHPDPAVRAEGLRRLDHLAAMCAGMGIGIVTLGSGSRNPDDMWAPHRDNGSAEAWRDLLACMERALDVAERRGVALALEPEAANVANDARAARRVLDAMGSPRLRIVFDAANLVVGRERASWDGILEEAAELLGGDIALAHAKDVRAMNARAAADGAGSPFRAVGRGDLDFASYFRLLRTAGFDGPVVMHGLEERDAAAGLAHLQKLS